VRQRQKREYRGVGARRSFEQTGLPTQPAPSLPVDTLIDIRALERFYRGIYLEAFAAQAEPLEAWLAALRGDAAYDFTVNFDDDAGITYERYRRSGCGLVTYMVVAPTARRSGVGRRLLDGAIADLRARGAPIVFGEVNDPRRTTEVVAWDRLERFQRWGARVLDMPYVQPSLGSGRDRGLLLVAFSVEDREVLDGAIVKDFLDEFYRVTEGEPPDAELSSILAAIPERVPLVRYSRP
jgi:GNAT superfamily N-acetyltransferase